MTNALIWIFAGICALGSIIGAVVAFSNITTGVFPSPAFAILMGVTTLAVGASFLYLASILHDSGEKTNY